MKVDTLGRKRDGKVQGVFTGVGTVKSIEEGHAFLEKEASIVIRLDGVVLLGEVVQRDAEMYLHLI